MTNNRSHDLSLEVFMCIIFSFPWMILRQYGKNYFDFEGPFAFYSHLILSILFITGQITTMAFYITEFGFIACVLHKLFERKLLEYL